MTTLGEEDRLPRPALSREELLSDSWQRDQRATRLLRAIELRAAYMRAASRRVIHQYFIADQDSVERKFDADYLQGIRYSARSADPVTVDDLERYSAYWRGLVPDDPNVRAVLADLVTKRYPSEGRSIHGIEEALSLQASADGFPVASSVSPDSAPPLPPASDEQLLRDVEANLTWIHLPGGATLFREGDASDSLYLIISGRLRAALAGEGGTERVLSDMGRDEVVGEIGTLTGERRSATVYALRDSELVRLSREAAIRLAQRYPQVLRRLTRMLASRLRASNTGGITRNLQTIALVATGPIPLAEFAVRCAKELAVHGSVLHLDRARIESQLGAEALHTADRTELARLLGWLEEQESRYQYVLYEADSSWSDWTRLCALQADRIVLVADAESDPAPGQTEAELPARVPIELVLLHPATRSRPTGTQRWLRQRRVLSHHHVRLGHRTDLARMVRRVLGRAHGLVLSGGGARGAAHVGIIRALEEMGIELDMIGGTSMGAYFGSAYARGASFQDLLDLCRRYGARRRLLDLTLPFTSFFTSAKVTQAVHDAADNWEIEDLWRPFFCISSNLTTAEPVIHDEGPLWQAVRASIALPTVYAPVLKNGEVLVDGGLVNNFPLDVMRQRCPEGIVLGVSLSPTTESSEGYEFGAAVSGWKVLWGKTGLVRETIRAPSLFDTLLRSIELGGAHRMKSDTFLQLADLVIRPQVEHIGLLDFASYWEAIGIGYRAAQEALAQRDGALAERLRQ